MNTRSAILTVTAKGQVTLRKEVLGHLGVAPGDKIVVDLQSTEVATLRPAKTRSTIEQFFGSLHQPDSQSLSIEDMNEIIQQGWAGKR